MCATIIDLENYRAGNVIEVSKLRANVRGLIAPAEEVVEENVVADHAAQPIKSMDDINRICEFLLKNERYRDYMLFVTGINFGLRASDLRELRFQNLINDNLTFKDTFPVFEKKTRNTRKKKKNRYVTINNAVIDAVTIYLEHTPGVCLSDYMFTNESSNAPRNQPLAVYSIERLLKGIAKDCDLNIHVSTHTLRKTFCYWMMVYGQNDPRRLLLLQKMLNHSSVQQTLDYIGITTDEIYDAYKSLNLGTTYAGRMCENKIIEREAM